MSQARRRIDLSWRRRNIAALLCVSVVWACLLCWSTAHKRRWFAEEPTICPRRVAAARERIDPNTAPAASLRRLSGVGPVLAEAIVSYRRRYGPVAFRCAEDLVGVRGIGPGTLRRIEAHLLLPPSPD
ncbi:MAG: helix-hairpin-helix domain-containing protein [Phycisphaerae bacterium]|nr:helix-hairpin-helix domain-containing protein [Phycisphaerae bacterium]